MEKNLSRLRRAKKTRAHIRKLGVARLSPAHFPRCIPYAYLPPQPAPLILRIGLLFLRAQRLAGIKESPLLLAQPRRPGLAPLADLGKLRAAIKPVRVAIGALPLRRNLLDPALDYKSRAILIEPSAKPQIGRAHV